jgi:hypothetical protein
MASMRRQFSEMNRDVEPVLEVMAIVVGAVFLAIGAYWSFDTVQFVRASERTEGTVTEQREFHWVWVDFTTPDGEHYGYEQKAKNARIGDRVGVRYLPHAPWRDASMDSLEALYGFGATFTAAGLGGIGLGAGRLRRRRRSERIDQGPSPM